MNRTVIQPSLPVDPLRLLDNRAFRSPHYAYKLNTATGTYGLDVAFPERLDIDPARMSVRIYFADGTRRDGVGDLTEVGGIKTDRHVRNPIVLFDHGKGDHKFAKWPIALAEDSDTKQYTVTLDPMSKMGYGDCFFYQGHGLPDTSQKDADEFALFCEQIFHLIENRFIRAGSFQYQIVKALQLPPDYETGAPQGLHMLVTTLLEFGPTVIPANADTVRKNGDGVREILCMPEVCGKKLSPCLVKSLEPYAVENTVTVTGYEGKALPTWIKIGAKVRVDDGSRVFVGVVKEILRGGILRVTTPDGGDMEIEASFVAPVKSFGSKSVEKARHPYNQYQFMILAWPERATHNEIYGASDQQEAINFAEGFPRAIVQRRRGEGMNDWNDIAYIRDYKVKSVEEIPHGDLSETDIPPARWKPGLGAEKAMDVVALYNNVSSASRDKIESAFRELEGQNLAANELQKIAEQLYISRKFDNRRDMIAAMRQTVLDRFGAYHRVNASLPDNVGIAKSEQDNRRKSLRLKYGKSEPQKISLRILEQMINDGQLKLISGTLDYGEMVEVEGVGTGIREKLIIETRAWGKNLNQTIEEKSLNPLRLKYRASKGYRRRMRKSSPGTSFVLMDSKDIETVRTEATKQGLKFAHVSTQQNGYAKVKLIGSDEAIDSVAKQWGKRVGSKTLIKALTRQQKQDVLQVAQRLHDAGDRISATNLYHAVKRKFGWDVAYDFDKGEELMEVLHDNGWDYDKGIKNMATVTREVKSAPKGMKDLDDKDKEQDKDMDTSTTETAGAPSDGEPREDEEMADEKYSATVLRRLHEDANLLLEQYDAMRGPLEHEEIDSHLQSKLETLVSEIEEIESLFDKHHPDATPLDSAGTKDNSDGADSEERKEPTPEEAVAGMEGDKKSAKAEDDEFDDETDKTSDGGVFAKSLRNKYGKGKKSDEGKKKDEFHKGMKCATCKHEPCTCSKSKSKEEDEDKKSKSDIPGEEENVGNPGTDETENTIPLEPGSEEGQPKPGENTNTLAKALEDHERYKVSEASGYLKELAATPEYSDEHRMKAYHYHKALGDMAVLKEQDNKVNVTEGEAKSDIPGEEENQTKPGHDETNSDVPLTPGNEETKSDLHPHRLAAQGASMFFKDLSQERAFGDPHREKAMYWHKTLDPIGSSVNEANVEEPSAQGTQVKNMYEVSYQGQSRKFEAVNETTARRIMANFLIRSGNFTENDRRTLISQMNVSDLGVAQEPTVEYVGKSTDDEEDQEEKAMLQKAYKNREKRFDVLQKKLESVLA